MVFFFSSFFFWLHGACADCNDAVYLNYWSPAQCLLQFQVRVAFSSSTKSPVMLDRCVFKIVVFFHCFCDSSLFLILEWAKTGVSCPGVFMADWFFPQGLFFAGSLTKLTVSMCALYATLACKFPVAVLLSTFISWQVILFRVCSCTELNLCAFEVKFHLGYFITKDMLLCLTQINKKQRNHWTLLRNKMTQGRWE